MVRLIMLLAFVLVGGCGESGSPGGGTSPGGAAGGLPDITPLKPFVLEKDGTFHALIDVAPVWGQVEVAGNAAARRSALGAVALMVLRRDACPKFPKATEFQVKLVRVTEYDSYNRPMIATGKELVTGRLAATQVPADLTPEAVRKAIPATAALSWTEANLK